MGSLAKGTVDVSKFARTQKELLQLERDEEVLQASLLADTSASLRTTEAAGLAISRLSLFEQSSTTGNRTRATFVTRGGRVVSPARLSTGDIIAVVNAGDAEGRKNPVSGVLIKLEETKFTVIIDEAFDGLDSHKFAIIKATSSVSHKRYKYALDELEKAADDVKHPAHEVINVIFGKTEARFDKEIPLNKAQEKAASHLNDNQRDAIMLALSAKDVAVIHGPPGTGKSTTMAALIHVEVLRGTRILVAAPSNVAADTLAEKLVATSGPNLKMVRAGHPARVLPSLEPYLLDNVVAASDGGALAQDVKAELDALTKTAFGGGSRGKGGTGKNSKSDGNGKAARGKGKGRPPWEEMRALRKELRNRDAEATKRVLGDTQVVVCTVSGAGARALDVAVDGAPFDLVIVDEAGQATESSIWVALLRGKRCVLAGDPFQLPPTVICEAAERQGMGRSLLDRIFEQKSLHDSAVRILTVQYRMHETISNWSSGAMYQDQLVPHETVRHHLLADISTEEGASDEMDLITPFVIVDTADGDCDEEGGDEELEEGSTAMDVQTSRRNRAEAEIICDYLAEFIRLGIQAKDIGIISPYSGQVELLRSQLRSKYGKALEISTVDSFQGREKEAIILSLVRANDGGEVGFLKDDRRINVAVTRARRAVVITCDSATVTRHKFLKELIEYGEERGEIRSAIAEYSHIVGEGGNVRIPPEAIAATKKEKGGGSKGKKKAGKKKANPFA